MVVEKPPNLPGLRSAKWQVIDHAIRDWGSTFRLAFLILVMGITGWGGWILAAHLLSR